MKSFFRKVKLKVQEFFKSIAPGKVAIKGAAKAIGSTTLIIWLIASSSFFILSPKTWFGIFPVLVIPIVALLIGGLTVLLFKLLQKLPKQLIWVLPGTYLLMSLAFGQGALEWKLPLFIVLFAGGLGAALFTLTKKNRGQNSLKQNIVAYLGATIGILGLVWGLNWALDTGSKPEVKLINAGLETSFRPNQISLPDPSSKGSYSVSYLTYGSGKDKHRPEFGEGVSIETDSVDGSRLIDNWEGFSGNLRTKYWGFDSEALPLNGRVWYPEGNGPFPLALIVHGNHSMFDYSDPGYAYLGELLASHGIIMVSVDQNFINSGWTDVFTDGLTEENDARGWLLLKHLELWREWNKSTDNPFSGKIDMNKLAVMGHSRGGEAAAVAGFFNTLDYYPDDAKEKFNFGFNIKSIVSIAPVDGQYDPGNVSTPLKDVNYFVIHGSNDGDVQSFGGLRQYERVKFSDSTDFFKSAVYVYGANHGQFNTSWGNKDNSYPWATLLNLEALMPMEDQLTIGKVFINSFLQATLNDQVEYKALFKDHRSGLAWLPETIYLNQYEDSKWQTIANYDKDLDLVSAENNAQFSSQYLTVWKEKLVNMKWGNRGTRAVYIGWDSTAYPIDTARYKLEFSEPMNISESPIFTFEMAHAKENSYPDKERDEKKKSDSGNQDSNNNNNNAEEEIEEENDGEEESENEEEEEEKKGPDPINFSIKLTDQQGESIVFTLEEYALLQPQITVDVLKNPSLSNTKRSEAIYQTFFFNIEQLADPNLNFDKAALKSIEWVFDQTQRGVVILDKIALHQD